MLSPSLIVLSLLAASASAAPATSSATSSASHASSSSAPAYNYTLTAKGFNSKQWVDGFEKARSIVAQMTLAEKGAFSSFSPVFSLLFPSYPVAVLCPTSSPTASLFGDGELTLFVAL
jgi:hypothetical protein